MNDVIIINSDFKKSSWFETRKEKKEYLPFYFDEYGNKTIKENAVQEINIVKAYGDGVPYSLERPLIKKNLLLPEIRILNFMTKPKGFTIYFPQTFLQKGAIGIEELLLMPSEMYFVKYFQERIVKRDLRTISNNELYKKNSEFMLLKGFNNCFLIHRTDKTPHSFQLTSKTPQYYLCRYVPPLNSSGNEIKYYDNLL